MNRGKKEASPEVRVLKHSKQLNEKFKIEFKNKMPKKYVKFAKKNFRAAHL